MSTEYSGNPAVYPETITVVSAGDVDKIAELQDGINDLADRTAYLGSLQSGLRFQSWNNVLYQSHDDPADLTSAIPIDRSYLRSDDTADLFFSVVLGSWIILGNNTAGKIFTANGLHSHLTISGFGAANVKYSHGLETADGRLLLLSHDDSAATSLSGAAGSLGAWTNPALPGVVSVYALTTACVLTHADTVLVVGGRDSNYKVYRSTNNGVTFAEISVTGIPVTSFFSGVALGGELAGNDLIFAWSYETTADGGENLWWSDDDGLTWTATGNIGHEFIRQVVYVEAHDQYMVTTDTHYAIVNDPTDLGGYTWIAANVISATTDGTNLFAVIPAGPVNNVLVSSDMFSSADRMVTTSATVDLRYDYGQLAFASPLTFRASANARGTL